MGSPFSGLFTDTTTAEHLQALLIEVFNKRVVRVGEGMLQIGKSRIWGRLTCRPIRIVGLRLVLLVLEDLSLEKQQLNKNIRLREELEILVEQRTADLRESNERLRQAVEEEKQSKEAFNRSEVLLRQVFNTMDSGVLVLGRNGEVQLANRSALSFLRLDDKVTGKTLNEVLPDFGITGIDRSSHDQTETRVTLRDGASRLFGFTATSVEADGRTVVVFRDITDAVERRERQRRAEELALVGEMVSRLSHEIKNPLASILMGVKTLQRDTPQSSQQGQMLQILLEEVNSLMEIVSELLESAHPRKSSPSPVYIDPLLKRCVDAHGFQTVRRGVRLEIVRFPVSTFVLVDERSLLRCLSSLVQNALDACSKGDLIRIGWRELDQAGKDELVPGFSGNVVAIFVEDSGPGIPDELSVDQSQVFKAFVSTKDSGTGLGLTVARDIVEDHGGVIVMSSLYNRGTRVEILLPIPEGIPCWDWNSDQSVDCASCSVRSTGTGYYCWKQKQGTYDADTGKPPEGCLKCEFFRASSLIPFFSSRLVASKVE
jgi:signal transduction histidine kinase